LESLEQENEDEKKEFGLESIELTIFTLSYFCSRVIFMRGKGFTTKKVDVIKKQL